MHKDKRTWQVKKKQHNKLNCLQTRNQNKTKIQNQMNKINLYTYSKARIYRISSENKESRRPKKSVYSARRKRNAKNNIIF